MSMKKIAACALVCLWSLPAFAVSGVVIDPDGKPIDGADACYVIGKRQGLCVKTDERGHFEIAPSHVEELRIYKEGFVPEIVSAKTLNTTVVLTRSAILHVKVLDAGSGEGIAESRVLVRHPSGQNTGPVPANAFGVIMKSLRPGEVVVEVRAAGYREASGEAALRPGEKTETVVSLTRADPPASDTAETDEP